MTEFVITLSGDHGTLIVAAGRPTVEVTLRLPLGPNDHLTIVRDASLYGVDGPTGDYVTAAPGDELRVHVKNWLEDADSWDQWPTVEAAILAVIDATAVADSTDTTDWQRGYRAAAENARRAIVRAIKASTQEFQ